MGIPTPFIPPLFPQRRRLLQNAGIEPLVRVSDFDESQIQLVLQNR